MAQIVIDNLRGGWIQDYSLSSNLALQGRSSQYSRSTAISLFRLGKEGHIAPGETFTAITDASSGVNALPLNGVVDSAGETFCILETGARVVQFGIGDETIDNFNATSDGHATLVGEDILAYKNATDEYVLYSYRDATDWNVGRRTKSSGAWADTFLTGLATQQTDSGDSARTANKSNPVKMIIGPDGIIYITNGHYIVSHDPSSTIVNYAALNLGFGWIATGLCIHGNYLAIIGYKASTFGTSFSKSEARVWLWDGFSPDPNFIYDLNDNFTTGILNNNGLLYSFSQGIGNTLKVKWLSGNRFETIFESAQIGNPPRPGSIERFENKIHFANNGAERLMVIDDKSFHYRTAITTDGSTTSSDVGMVKNLSSNVLYVGRKVSSSFHIVKINYSGYYINAVFKHRLIELPYKSNLISMTFFFSQFGAGASVYINLYKDYNSMSAVGAGAGMFSKQLTNSALGAVTSFTFPIIGIGNISSFAMGLYFDHASVTNTAAIVRAIILEYEPSGQKL